MPKGIGYGPTVKKAKPILSKKKKPVTRKTTRKTARKK